MMTSSMHDLSEKSEPDEQHIQVEPEMQHPSSSSGIVQPGMIPPTVDYMMPPNHLEVGHTMAQTAYPYVDPYYGGMIATYAGQPALHPHLMGVIPPAMPLPSDAVVEPVYVNAKQYHGILRRRQSRAKAESENRLIKSRKPYLHESRHLHALKRARGNGGRFLNSKTEEENQEKGEPSNDGPQPSGGTSSESCSGDLRHAEKPQEGMISDPDKQCLDDGRRTSRESDTCGQRNSEVMK